MTQALQDRAAGNLTLIGGRLCLDFVNTVGARRIGPAGELIIRDEYLNDYFDLVIWARHANAVTEVEMRALIEQASLHPSEGEQVLRLALRLRESLYRIVRSSISGRTVDERDLAVLNEEVRIARDAQEIAAASNGFKLQLKQQGTSLDKILWLVSDSASELLLRSDLSRLRQCSGDDCGWLFEDTTRNRSRHWCDMRDCGNRDHVRRFRQRQRKGLSVARRRSK